MHMILRNILCEKIYESFYILKILSYEKEVLEIYYYV